MHADILQHDNIPHSSACAGVKHLTLHYVRANIILYDRNFEIKLKNR